MSAQITPKPLIYNEFGCSILENPVLGLSGLEPDSFSAYFISNLTQAIENLREDVFDQTTEKQECMRLSH